MADTAYPPANVAATMPAAAYPPPNVQPVVNEPSIHARAPSQLDVIAHVESGNRNIPQQIHDVNTDRGTPAGGNFQFITPTWQRYAPKAGVDVRQYPTPMSAPAHVQAQVAGVTPINQWGPNTVAALKAHFPGLDTSKPPTGPYGGVVVGGAPATPISPATSVAAAPRAPVTSVGDALARLTQPTGEDGKGRSPLEKAAEGMGGQQQGQGQQQAPEAPPDQSQAAAGLGMAHQQQVAALASQLAAQVRARGMQPISWGSAPPGTGAGQLGPVAQFPPPGVTLNSMGGQNG